jgi:hypothetical protein
VVVPLTHLLCCCVGPLIRVQRPFRGSLPGRPGRIGSNPKWHAKRPIQVLGKPRCCITSVRKGLEMACDSSWESLRWETLEISYALRSGLVTVFAGTWKGSRTCHAMEPAVRLCALRGATIHGCWRALRSLRVLFGIALYTLALACLRIING